MVCSPSCPPSGTEGFPPSVLATIFPPNPSALRAPSSCTQTLGCRLRPLGTAFPPTFPPTTTVCVDHRPGVLQDYRGSAPLLQNYGESAPLLQDYQESVPLLQDYRASAPLWLRCLCLQSPIELSKACGSKRSATNCWGMF